MPSMGRGETLDSQDIEAESEVRGQLLPIGKRDERFIHDSRDE
jgi:hypothetical protein